jgi:hypothetical protein
MVHDGLTNKSCGSCLCKEAELRASSGQVVNLWNEREHDHMNLHFSDALMRIYADDQLTGADGVAPGLVNRVERPFRVLLPEDRAGPASAASSSFSSSSFSSSSRHPWELIIEGQRDDRFMRIARGTENEVMMAAWSGLCHQSAQRALLGVAPVDDAREG